ncbi:MAG: hypothetical protein H0T62_10630 [Parachlamydiaceae bacterium]|nr:hypothetical protein [Parachlamydiaceae bacterium]
MVIEEGRLGQKIYVDESEMTKYTDWKDLNIKDRDKKINLKGLKYKVLEKKEHHISFCSLKRIGGIALGLLCSLPTLGLALLSKTIRQFFSGREVVIILQEEYHKDYVENILKYLPDSLMGQKNSSVDEDFYKMSARNFLEKYINDPELQESLKIPPQEILDLYDRLTQLSSDDQNWTNGIAQELLPQVDDEIQEEEDELLADLRTKILKNVILQDVIIETDSEEEWIGSQARLKPDEAAKHHRFVRLQSSSPPNARLLFQICADEFGAGSELEGNNSSLMVKDKLDFLKKVEKGTYPEELIDELNRAIDLSKIQIGEASEQIQAAIKNQQRTLILGGWAGVPSGHAIYYEVIPTEDDEVVNFRLYNTGAGIQYHKSVREGNAVKYQPYCEWRGIKTENVLSHNFLKAIHEMTSIKIVKKGKSTNYNENDVYLGLKGLLNPASDENEGRINIPSDMMMSPQHAGVCASRSLSAWERSYLPLFQYKRIKIDYKLNKLLDFVENQEKFQIKVEDWRLIQKTYHSVCRGIIKLHEKKLVGDFYIESVLEDLSKTREWIKGNKFCCFAKRVQNINPRYRNSSRNENLKPHA